jgi:hypothetical protein
MKRAGLVTAILVTGLALSACGGVDTEAAKASASAAAEPEQTRLAAAYDACTQRDSGDTLSLEDDDTTIVIDTRSKYGDPAGYLCVLDQLDVPSSITAQMDRTTALMGVQDATQDGLDFSWSYHPDNGVNMVIIDTEAAGK